MVEITEITKRLFELQDEKYRDFQGGLIPDIEDTPMIGVRTPALRVLAKELYGTELGEKFMANLPHRYYEENNLHAFMIERIRDYDECVRELEKFMPYIDNWATSDQMNPAVFKKNHDRLLETITRWLESEDAFTVRYAIRMLMCHFLDADYDVKYLDMVDSKKDIDHYYVRMMIAWYYATALAKQYDTTVKHIEAKVLPEWTHNKAIQKAIESNRVSNEHKAYLRTLRR